MKAKYYDNKNKLDAKTQILIDAKISLIKINVECIRIKQEIKTSINRFKEIASNKNDFKSIDAFIDELILNEKNEYKDGWQTRIKGLQVMKEISQGKIDNFDKIQQLTEESILNLNEDNLLEFVQDIRCNKTGDNNCFIY